MATSAFGAVVRFESTSPIANPAAAVRKDGQGIARAPSEYELNHMRDNRQSGPSGANTGAHTPINTVTPSVLESHPGSPAEDGAIDPLPNPATSSVTKWRLLSACLMNMANGLNDSGPGALIPYIEKDYNIGYAVMSLIFVTNALGFILAAPFTQLLETKLGRSKSYALSMGILAAGYVIILCKPPFPAVVASFFLLGFGMALSLALNNVFCANLANSTAALGGLHGSYGIGGTMGPLIATAMVSGGVRWSFYYSINLAFSLVNLAFGMWAFRNYEKDLPVQLLTALQQTVSQQEHGHAAPNREQLLKQTVKNKTTLLGALFIFAYQGAEVSISGWVVSFLISYRNGNPSQVGYVSAGFWAGITLGRFLLSHPTYKVGEKLAVVVLVVGSAAFQLMTWLIPNVIGDAVSVAIVGLLLGPVCPCAMAVFSKLLPRNIQISSLSFISAMGSSGGAVSPFFTGLLAQSVGTYVLHPICIGLYGLMLVGWVALPKISKRSE
ncbi:putative MFS efflux transporter [Aspergillus clavatus NRRL 1]|uniref:MFS efflux transporter, putative n=1 Tax=Aspergillus clavatus (strain ATCC 1007 / CBS 513.65 / DSM 816 / NCTC 3887 / NRRL 1 / QM 1276 / 107) TaxID=344612 RepID=A1CBE4_ASPCL|nr:MFS efflux transporter, putative [Aspergillus clavatus NRRL 1]EAW13062.1 MFS efflux transporter, putative [Aspergillus clavatus NRRL 1]